MGIAISVPRSFLLVTGSRPRMSGVIRAGWKLVGMAMLLPVIGNVVYEATFDGTESSGRMELRGRANLQAEKRHGVK
jgi:hypothetical protein